MANLVPQLLGSNIKKPTALVHFERDLSPLEQKIMTLIIFHCQISQKDQKGFFYIKKSFIKEFIGWDESNNYPRIYEAFESIFNNSIKWNFLGIDKTFKGLKCKLIISLLEPGDTGQYIGFQLHQDLEPLIRDPKAFAKLKLIMIALLTKPKYSYSLYELFADCYSRGQRSVRIALQTLKDYLGIPNSYCVFKDFKNRVLVPSIEGINRCSDYVISYETYRSGRNIAGIVFHIKMQHWEPPLLLGPLRELQRCYENSLLGPVLDTRAARSAEEKAFIESVAPYRIAESDALQAVEAYGLEGALEIRDYVLQEVDRRKGKKDKVRDIGAYMARCLREGYGRTTPEQRAEAEADRVTRRITREKQQAGERIQAQVEQMKTDFWSHQMRLVEAQLEVMDSQNRQALERKFLQSNPVWGRKYLASGLESPLVRSAFYNFAADELLTESQRDIVSFAKAHGASEDIVQRLQNLA